MSKSLTVESTIQFKRRDSGARRVIRPATPSAQEHPLGRVPRISRLMALAIRFDQLIAEGKVTDYAELARLGHVTRARMTQIMNLRLLAPDIQEQLLFLPRIERGREALYLRQLQAIAAMVDWRKQRRSWVIRADDMDQTQIEPTARALAP